jgi:sugar fermentation stimulation protein A
MAPEPHRFDGKRILFAEPLRRGIIVRRPNRFIIDVDLDGTVHSCHCPTTGRIGNLSLDGLPCLLSRSPNPARKSKYTVEAISVDDPNLRARLRWIGINQNAANRYVEAALRNNLLTDLITATTIERERRLGQSRLDFLVNNDTYIEVKTPLEPLQIPLGDHIRTRKIPPLAATDRLVKHLSELGDSLEQHQRAVLLICFLYDNPGFIARASSHHSVVQTHVNEAVQAGVEIWQANFALDPRGVRPLRVWPLPLDR